MKFKPGDDNPLVVELADLIKAADGDTGEASKVFRQSHPDVSPKSMGGLTKRARRVAGYSGSGNGHAKVAVPGQFTEALQFAAHLSKLNEEEHKIEARLAEIRAEKLKYSGVVNAMNALKQQVDKAKST